MAEEKLKNRNITEKAALVLEGGGSRGVFTAGVLDYFMERGLYFPYVVGVSAGACNALDYVSGQIGRSRDTFIVRDRSLRSFSFFNLFKTGYLYDMDKPFRDFPYRDFPFDFDTFKNSGIICEMVATNIDTGKAEYLSDYKDNDRILEICRASSTLPLAAPIVNIDGKRYMDGGLSDSIPYGRSIRLGYKKSVVILTRCAGYRKNLKSNSSEILRLAYPDEHRLLRSCILRPKVYNRQLDILERLEREGRLFVIRPTEKVVSRTEYNTDSLDRFYQHGYNTAIEIYDSMIRYLMS
ncbi:MAG: patatin family protein [Lachnospiraceae bacterium]|nr:patatin family protein [Lachnospiraceae bacterium]